jgi:predicted amidophosphoribosyltransferase
MAIKYYKICPECSFFCRIEEKDRFCSICGAELAEKCPHCGEKIDNPYAEYCKYCGARYRTDEETKKINNF